MRKFQSCNFSSVGCSARGPCSVEKAESIYSKSREMCYHSMSIYLFHFRLEKLFDQGEYSFAMFYVFNIYIRNLRCGTSHRRRLKWMPLLTKIHLDICIIYVLTRQRESWNNGGILLTRLVESTLPVPDQQLLFLLLISSFSSLSLLSLSSFSLFWQDRCNLLLLCRISNPPNHKYKPMPLAAGSVVG